MSEFVQRWRIVFRRPVGAEPVAQRELIERWLAALGASGLPDRRLVIAAPLPAGVGAERELADLWLSSRRTLSDVRTPIAASLPAGLELVDLYDVWIGEPALPGRVVAADYRIRLSDTPDAAVLEAGAGRLMASASLPRERVKGERRIAYDLRPLLGRIGPVEARDGAIDLDLRVLHRADQGVGRPEEVVAALVDATGCELRVAWIVRIAVVLADETGSDRAVP
jgi:hypothetical protein